MLDTWRRICEWGHALFGDDFEAHVDIQGELVVWTFLFPHGRYVDLLAEEDKARVQE